MASTCALLAALLLQTLVQNTLESKPEDDFYIAAVVEYKGNYVSKDGNEILQTNIEKHLKLIEEAHKENADIIVFPELGLLSYDHTVFIEVPDPADKIVPADNNTWGHALGNLSEAARKHSIYVVTNLHELFKNNSEEYKYNTNIVFDRNGTLIARYRKYNLFGEHYLNRTETPDFVTFETDFGVTFGTFICFDIIFENPAVGLVRDRNITNIVYSTAWFSELPLHTAIQEQSAWAYSNNVNLLASGLNRVDKGNTGSGIYSGNAGPIVYVQSELDQSQLLIGKVPKTPGKNIGTITAKTLTPVNDTEGDGKHSKILHEDLKDFETFLLTPENMTFIEETNITISNLTDVKGIARNYEIDKELCDNTNKFCCNFNLKFTVSYYPKEYDFNGDNTFNKSDAYYHYRYRLIAFNGIRKYIVDDTTGQQLCAIMPCLTDTLESCAQANINTKPSVHILDGNYTMFSTEFTLINISAEFHNERVLHLPSILLSSETETDENLFGRLLTANEFKLNFGEAKDDKIPVNLQFPLSSQSIKFASGGILTRLFELDNKPNSANFVTIHTLLLCLIPILFYLSRNS